MEHKNGSTVSVAILVISLLAIFISLIYGVINSNPLSNTVEDLSKYDIYGNKEVDHISMTNEEHEAYIKALEEAGFEKQGVYTNQSITGLGKEATEKSKTDDTEKGEQEHRNEVAEQLISEMTDSKKYSMKLMGNAQTAKPYKTLAEAEQDMGYYLGLHNTIDSVEYYKLISVFNIGDGLWFQAIFEDDNLEKPSITIKTSKKLNSSELAENYELDKYYPIQETIKVGDIDVTFRNTDENGKYNLALLDTPIKGYTIFSKDGIDSEIMISIATELANNLQIMDDWIHK